MKTRIVYRKMSSVRRSPVPRRSSGSSSSLGAFGGMLARLGLASEQLRRARPRSR
ncbi:MAG TPA: hypothetical protein VLI90_20480 [Tepidisphaeraceae bacterium]|nr:hypothetical protein [Tepidisphaeraceae bacterium]